jgi:hypothetical protein
MDRSLFNEIFVARRVHVATIILAVTSHPTTTTTCGGAMAGFGVGGGSSVASDMMKNYNLCLRKERGVREKK